MDLTKFHARREDLPPEHVGDYESRRVRFGPITASFERVPAGFPAADVPAYRGMPDEACQVPHWGFVFRGRMRFTHADGREQVISAGEAYYVPAGHRWLCLDETELIEFSPTDELDAHRRQLISNLDERRGRR